jgi:3-methylcrotonyl-CoA carboxylase alpha subunit
MFTTILIANRGEIACRVASTARKLGIKTIAVYSDADAQSKHVESCDVAVRIGPAAASESYLRGDVILDVAKRYGAQAIHPGYGFLSENEGFALACDHADITFVGPPVGAIAAMGSKAAAKSLMEKAGVPLVPGYHGENQAPEFLRRQADAMGYPVLIKASAGGGGKGMRVVESSLDFDAALASCQRESRSSFGDDRVLIERYLQKPRHIEIQIFADKHGHCIYLFERDCSIQRRHQKVIEEAPAPEMSASMRQAMGEAAVKAAQAVDYVGAGTVEFIVEPNGQFYFMEMNTRLQVEHPVTEMITGLDLVEWQLRVAAGEPLPLTQEQLQRTGHAIEARIYAENTEKGFLPSIGRLTHVAWPKHVNFTHGEVRVDAGVRSGDEISPYYDPMIAKLIVWGATREQARLRMLQALSQTQIVGVHTNVNFLSRVMDDDAFASADLDTGFIERRHATVLPERIPASDFELACAVVAVVSEAVAERDPALLQTLDVNDPWSILDGWRLSGHYRRPFIWLDAETQRKASVLRVGPSTFLEIEGRRYEMSWQSQCTAMGVHELTLRWLDGQQTATVIKQEARADVFTQGKHVVLRLQDPLKQFASGDTNAVGGLNAPMPGKIIALHVEVGQQVKKGDALIVMEAMKMEHVVFAPADGVVKEVFFSVGEQVSEGVGLIELA